MFYLSQAIDYLEEHNGKPSIINLDLVAISLNTLESIIIGLTLSDN